MGASRCESKAAELEVMREKHARVLKIVLAVNAAMFGVEFIAGVLSKSSSLLADSLDMLGDAFVYSFSLFVLYRSTLWRAGAAVLKGVIMAAFGIGVLAEAIYKGFVDVVPQAQVIGVIGLLALAANSACFFMLYRFRADDLNMRSTWLCSRNDIIANCGVLAASLGVALTGTKWPDLVVGAAIAGLFLSSTVTVLREAIPEFQKRTRQA